MTSNFDVIIIGAGAAGLFCAGEAGARGRSVCLIEHSKKLGEKIRISGGGRCNFTNLYSGPENFISANPHFCKSALSRFTPHDFLARVEAHGIKWHEKKAHPNALGQLFCDESAGQIITMLGAGCRTGGVDIRRETSVTEVAKQEGGFTLQTTGGALQCTSLVIATGGLSIPKIGASDFGYRIAKQFGLKIIETCPALVPLTFAPDVLERTQGLSGVSVDASLSCNGAAFREGMLFTHRGLSGPSVLQISSYWNPGEDVAVNMTPETDMLEFLKTGRNDQPKTLLHNVLGQILPGRVAAMVADASGHDTQMANLSDNKIAAIAALVNDWRIQPSGTEGYRTAEVTRGGVDTNAVSSKTFEARDIPGLYFIGEVLDVTGHLGGHNFQWAWSSAWAAGQVC